MLTPGMRQMWRRLLSKDELSGHGVSKVSSHPCWQGQGTPTLRGDRTQHVRFMPLCLCRGGRGEVAGQERQGGGLLGTEEGTRVATGAEG